MHKGYKEFDSSLKFYGEDQQGKPDRSLNGFQHKKNTLQKGFFVSPNCELESPSPHFTCLRLQWPGPSVNLEVIQWAIEPVETAAQNYLSNHPCDLIKVGQNIIFLLYSQF